MDPSKFPKVFAGLQADANPNRHPTPDQFQTHLKQLAALRTDGDYPIVWAKKYGKGRVWYSTFGHLEATLDDPRIQQMYVGAFKWALGLTDADITPRPFPASH
jgi:type 1 glutamine amidotransferase